MKIGKDDKNECLIFIHVPKAGGTTLHSIINKQFTKNQILHISAEQTHQGAFELVKNIPLDIRDNLKVIKGHMPFGIHELLNQHSTYITYLRDPIKRLVSNYFYLVNNPGHYLYSYVVGKRMSMLDYVNSDLTTEVDNYQTRMISGINTDRFLYGKVPIVKCNKSDLELAISNLNKYFLMVGLTSRFDESLLLLKRYFGWSNIYYFNMKETRYKNSDLDIPEKTLKEIRRKNEFDIELYDFAEKKFNELIESQDNQFHDELRQFRRKNFYYKSLMKIPYKIYTKVKGI